MASRQSRNTGEHLADEVVILYTRERLSFRKIAARLDKDVKDVYEAWKRGRARYAAEAAANHGTWVGEQLAIIDEVITGLMPAVREGDSRAADTVLRALDRQARLLGLDAPMKANVTVTDEMTARVRALAEELAGLDS